MIKKITIVGGTHGNELIGPHLIRKLEQDGSFKESTIPVDYLLANIEAHKAVRRFMDADLNRSFTDEVLDGDDDSVYEHRRAREINRLLDPKTNDGRFIIDLHSTTSNMGMTLIIKDQAAFNLQAASYVQQHMPDVKIILSDRDSQFSRTLNSLSDYAVTIEVGPLPNGVLRHDQFADTESVIRHLVDFTHLSESEWNNALPATTEVYTVTDRVFYPRNDDGQVSAMVHSSLQDGDFEELKPGMPMFQNMDGTVTPYQGEPGYPIFINEAAYYYENTAFVMTNRKTVSPGN
ncbi:MULTISPECIES: aspartoacylase [unclassified Endozoicomonas]|uniref:aspartoacylase n=1 Tax=unclassified Endozoicomonas TaxID=2644528 RepID=UPI002148B27B|nr:MULTISPECIES: aspartoacylase [unclassified Endozoicomonas]